MDRCANAEYIVPPNSEGRIVSFSTRSTPPASRKRLAELLEIDGVRTPSMRFGSLILHDQELIGHGQKPSQERLLLLNEMQRVR